MPGKKLSYPTIKVPLQENQLLRQAVELVNKHEELKMMWKVININAIDRLGMSDHGWVHFQIVANIALRIARILMKNGVEMSVVKNYKLDDSYAELIVFLASILHDLGMTIHRDGHEEYSLFLADGIVKDLLAFLPVEKRVIIKSEVLHAIISHRSGGKPMTIEAGIVRVADALDMSNGRSRIPFDAGKINIHSLSAFAIENIEIKEGTEKPVQIQIAMNNSAGIFQIDELLKSKLQDSGIAQYFSVKGTIAGKTEKRLLKEFIL